MKAAALAWVVVGLAAGGAHAMALWRVAHRMAAGEYGVAGLGMVAVVTVLGGAAYAGWLLPTVVGWLVGLLGTAVLYVGAKRWSM